MSCYKPEEFLVTLTKSHFKENLGQHEFTQTIDLVLIGTCSKALPGPCGHETVDRSTREPNPEFFAWELGDVDKGEILLLSNCCGNYSSEFVDRLKALYPGINWIVPETRDFFGGFWPEDVADSLLWAKIIRKK